MKTSTLSLLTAFVSSALVGLVGAQQDPAKPAAGSGGKAGPGNQRGEKASPEDALPATQTAFILSAAECLLSDLEAAQLAIEKAGSAKVKELAKEMLKQQTAASTTLHDLAGKLDLSLPKEAGKARIVALKPLKEASGAAFDQTFLNFMAASRRRSVELYERGATVSNAEPVLTFVEKVLPSLRSDVQKIKELGGIDEEMAKLDSRQNEAPRVPKIPDTEVPSPR